MVAGRAPGTVVLGSRKEVVRTEEALDENPSSPRRNSRRRVELSPEEQAAKAKAAKEKTCRKETLTGVMYIIPLLKTEERLEFPH